MRERERREKDEIECGATVNSGGGVIYGSACPITMHKERERERERVRGCFDLGFGGSKDFFFLLNTVLG